MELNREAFTLATHRQRTTGQRQLHHVERNDVDCPKWSTMEKTPGKAWTLANCVFKISQIKKRMNIRVNIKALSKDADMENLSIDSTSSRVLTGEKTPKTKP